MNKRFEIWPSVRSTVAALRTPSASDAARQAQRQASDYGRQIQDLVVKHPQIAIPVAIGAGVIVGWLLKRRR